MEDKITLSLEELESIAGGDILQDRMNAEENAHYNKLHKRLTDLFLTDITSRYTQLRSSVLSEDNIVSEFEKFMGYIPPYLYEEDAAETTGGGAFTEIPLASEDHLRQIRDYVPKRLAYIDANLK